MNATGYVPLVDTSRDELRERIGQARERFDRLVRIADPLARPPGMKWTVQQIVAHVLTVARRYQGMAHGREYPHPANPRELDVINQRELEAAMAPIPELTDQLLTLAAEMDSFFDALTNEPATIPFPAGAVIDGITAQTNWLGELLLHGQDVARAVKTPWERQTTGGQPGQGRGELAPQGRQAARVLVRR